MAVKKKVNPLSDARNLYLPSNANNSQLSSSKNRKNKKRSATSINRFGLTESVTPARRGDLSTTAAGLNSKRDSQAFNPSQSHAELPNIYNQTSTS